MSTLCKVLPKVLGKVFSKVVGSLPIPANSLFYWPFFTDSLDEVLEGNDATLLRDSIATVDGEEVAANEPRFDANGLFLESAATQLLANPKWEGGGVDTAPTGWVANMLGGGTFEPLPAGTLGEVAYKFTATSAADRARIRLLNTPIPDDGLDHTYSFKVSGLTAGLTANDVVRVAGSGGTIAFPICEANPSGGSAGVLVDDAILLVTCNNPAAATTQPFIGLTIPVIGASSITISEAQAEAGTIRTSWIPEQITREADDATAPVSTSQVDASHGQSGTGTFALTGKYAGTEAAAMIGAIWVNGDNVVTATITGAVAATSITVTGTVSTTDKLFWHTSAYTLAGVKALRSAVGDGSTWIDTPVNDLFRQLGSVKINNFTSDPSGLLIREGSVDDEHLIYSEGTTAADLGIKYTPNSGSAIGLEIEIPSFDISVAITSIRVEHSSASGSTLEVVYNGTPYTDSDATTGVTVDQGVKDSFQYDGGSGFSHSIGSNAVGDL